MGGGLLQRVNRDTMSFGEPCWVPVHLCLGSAVPAIGAWMVHRTQTSVAHIGSLNCFCSCPAFATKRFCSGVPSDCCRSNPARPSPLQQPPHDPPPHTFLCSPAAASCVVPHSFALWCSHFKLSHLKSASGPLRQPLSCATSSMRTAPALTS